MRKLRQPFSYTQPTSIYSLGDYRSCLYSKSWESEYIKIVIEQAQVDKAHFFDICYKFANEKHEHLPDYLYKFFSFNTNSINALLNQTVYLAANEMLNDPYDSKIIASKDAFVKRYVTEKLSQSIENGDNITTYKELLYLKATAIKEDTYLWVQNSSDGELSRRRNESFSMAYSRYLDKYGYPSVFWSYYTEAIKKFDEEFPAKLQQNIRTSSFSALRDDQMSTFMEMWGHYASSHKGFCLRYNLKKLKLENSLDVSVSSSNNMVLSCLMPCEYLEKPRVIGDTYVYKKLMGIPLTAKEELNFEKSMIRSYLRKSSSWQYENEWRIVLPNQYTKSYNHSISFPYVDAVFLGCNMDGSDKKLIIDIIKSKNYKVYESRMSNDQYELSFRELQGE